MRTLSHLEHVAALVAVYFILIFAIHSLPRIAQDDFPSMHIAEIQASQPFDTTFEYASDIAILGRIPGHATGIRSIPIGNSHRFLITTQDATVMWEIYEVSQENQISFYG